MMDLSVPVNTPLPSPIDGCPRCVVNTEEPEHVAAWLADDHYLAFYHCADCGYEWHTTWIIR